MFLRLKNSSVTPQGYWRVTRDFGPYNGDPSTLIFGGDLPDLTEAVLRYRVTNNLDIENLDARISDWICRNVNVECVPVNVPRSKGPLAVGRMALQFLYAMGQWLTRGGHVDPDEAEARAETCASCTANVELDNPGCFGCAGIAAKIAAVIGDRKTRVDSSLRFCNVCGCSNAVSAWVPMDVLARVHKLEEFPSDIGNGLKCWKKEYADAHP
jgi:hypothetical protein